MPLSAYFFGALPLSWHTSNPSAPTLLIRFMSGGVRRKAKSLHVAYAFLFMKASGSQLRQITPLIESGAIRPVVDRVFPFASTNDALAYVESGHAKGKVVITLR